MAKQSDPDRYLLLRNGWYHYQRAVPRKLAAFYDAPLIRVSLGTRALPEARQQRDGLARADDEYWHALKQKMRLEAAGQVMDVEPAVRRYELAKARAMSAGFIYRPLHELADPAMIDELVRRSLAIGDQTTADGRVIPALTDAVLGGVDAPKLTVSEAMRLYQDEIAPTDNLRKSPAQLRLWKATKDRSLNYFVDAVGDLAMTDITRDHAQKYFGWWSDQISREKMGAKAKSPKTAARHFGDIRDLYQRYFKYLGEEDRANPFRNLNFKTARGKKKKRPAFSDNWVRRHILKTGAFDGISDDLFLVTCILIETGCRPGEVINLRPEDIRLTANVPHLVIPFREDREIKAAESEREIPLVGAALEAARRAPKGFPHYHDKTNSFSAALSAAFKRRGLFETPDHVAYSFRHAFENRMKEAGIDYELRCLLMGHEHDRPKYGDGGSLAYRQSELLKIAHPFPDDFFAAFDAKRGRAVA